MFDGRNKDPPSQWSQSYGNLYVYLRAHTEPYLATKYLTKMETARAISLVFKKSQCVSDLAYEICVNTLPDLVDSLQSRIPTYKALTEQIDEGGETSCEPLAEGERVKDLFNRCKIVQEIDLPGLECDAVSVHTQERINLKAIQMMMNQKKKLMPENERIRFADKFDNF